MNGAEWPVVVYSHLRWNFVYQRPQHVLSRLARTRRVLFVEEPLVDERARRLDVSVAAANVLRCVPSGRFDGAAFAEPQVGALAGLLARLLGDLRIGPHVAWLYTPMAVPLAERLAPAAVVYDCMDELALFAGAPPALAAHEARLFAIADLVFTGGPSLHRAKRDRHPEVHCFPSSVDVAHFAAARGRGAPGPEPRLGFYGVLDERLDAALVAAVAARRPSWRIELAGPVVKIDRARLPQAPNLRYLGAREYRELPALVADWDVCLLPFALNDATRFISPTKVLEYMAAERPIVSTPITDVAEPYGDVVHVAHTPEDFVAACEAALGESPAARARRTARTRAILAGTSWDRTVAAMAALIDRVTPRTEGASRWQPTTPSSSAPDRPA